MKENYQSSGNELLQKMGTDWDGWTEEQVKLQRNLHGENVLTEEKKKGIMQIFLGQFMDFLVIILMIAAIISMLSGNVESTIVILVVIILNAVLGTVQYVKAEKSLESLKALASPHAKVRRGGKIQEILSKDVVMGDILLLEAGDMISADGRILKNYSLQVNESALTGESLNVDKTEHEIKQEVVLADRINMVYAGTLVSYGRAEVLVTAIGMETEMGKIAGLMNATKEKRTPLQKNLDDFSKKLAFVIMVISGIVFGLRLYQGETFLDSLMFAVALAVAAIPEALSSIVTIVQAMGTRKMAAEHAIMKELKAVESLGCVSVICSDKTGTLTQNKMSVENVYVGGECLKPEELNLQNMLHRQLVYGAVLNNDSSLGEDGNGIGDPTEYCLLAMTREAGVLETTLRESLKRIEEIPFDSERKLMSTKYELWGKPTILTKGAVDVLLDRTVSIATPEGTRSITEEDKNNVMKQNQMFSENGLRVLAFAYKETENDEKLTLESEAGLTFIGLVAMIDPPRPESIKAVSEARDAGIRPIMITGDHKVTATAIAKQIGIFTDGDLAVTGQELDHMSDARLDQEIEKISVYARVSPENKIRIVERWQNRGNIVAMTGDGVNDAPALKKADIGVAMGITGTEVSKDAAAMILSDDNFATIINAVLNGRNVYRNILNAVQFLLSGNMAGILIVLYCSLLALPTPFEPVHLLFINLLTDSLPALAIGMEPADEKLLKEKPRDPRRGILNRKFCIWLVIYGGLIAIVSLVAFYMGLETNARTASTMAFATLTLARLFHGFNCRSEHSVLTIGLCSNKWSIAAFLTGVFLLLTVLLVPGLKEMFLVAELTVIQMLEIAGLALLPTAVVQTYRFFSDDVV